MLLKKSCYTAPRHPHISGGSKTLTLKCVTYEELKEGKEVTPKTQNYLGNRKEFDLDKPTIIKFCDFAVKFFDNV